MLNGKNILLGVSGGIAAYKIAILVRLLKKSKANVKIVMTPNSREFVTPLTLSTLSENPVYIDFSDKQTGEWNNHVELGLWADVFVIAPATANTMAKMAQGNCDNLLLATYLSCKCPVYFAPAMDLDMYLHATTQQNIQTLTANGNMLIDAKEGELASGLVGKGRMEEPEEIYQMMVDHFVSSTSLKNKNVLITAGPTYEAIDPVRFIGNHSSGKMGLYLAQEALKRGAHVTLVIGPNRLNIDPQITTVHVKSANEMFEAVHQEVKKADIIIMSAAVSDYTPKMVSDRKLKKKTDTLTIDLEPTQDILKSVGALKTKKQLLVGFALETNNEKEYAAKKLKAKNLDLIVLNSLNDKGAGFGYDTNKVTLMDAHNNVVDFELKPKSEVARDIFNKIISLLHP